MTSEGSGSAWFEPTECGFISGDEGQDEDGWLLVSPGGLGE